MNLPKNGRIVVVDDNPKEALPLVRSLAKSGHPVLFFSGKEEELPQRPIRGTRILFLDMVLVEGIEDPRFVLSALKAVLKKILNKNNGPFLAIAWTKHSKYVDELQQYFDKNNFHVLVAELDKSKYGLSEGGRFNMRLLNSDIAKEIAKKKSFKIFTCWENIAHESAMTTVNQISSLEESSNDWNDKMKSIIFKTATAYAGEKLDPETPYDVIKNSLFSLSGVFTDNLHNLIRKDTVLKKINLTFSSSGEQNYDLKDIGKINSKLNLVLPPDESEKYMPGSVYELDDIQDICPRELLMKPNAMKSPCKEMIPEMEFRTIILEATPACDYAQNKQKMHRLVPGFLCPGECYNYVKNTADFVYRSPIIEYDKKPYCLVFDFRLFTSVTKEEIERFTYLFRIKQELLADFQSRLASHVSRLGVVGLEK